MVYVDSLHHRYEALKKNCTQFIGERDEAIALLEVLSDRVVIAEQSVSDLREKAVQMTLTLEHSELALTEAQRTLAVATPATPATPVPPATPLQELDLMKKQHIIIQKEAEISSLQLVNQQRKVIITEMFQVIRQQLDTTQASLEQEK
jgi:hypothetical protein